jgi:hypothetical protein
MHCPPRPARCPLTWNSMQYPRKASISSYALDPPGPRRSPGSSLGGWRAGPATKYSIFPPLVRSLIRCPAPSGSAMATLARQGWGGETRQRGRFPAPGSEGNRLELCTPWASPSQGDTSMMRAYTPSNTLDQGCRPLGGCPHTTVGGGIVHRP